MTFSELESVSKEGLKSFSISWQHHGSSYDWTHVRALLGLEFQRYRNVHALRINLDQCGLSVKWKQFVSDESWSRPRILMDDAQVQIFGQARPPLIQHQFSDQDQAKHMNFLDKLESWLGRSTNF